MHKFIASTVLGALLVLSSVPASFAAQKPLTFVRRAEAVMVLLKHAGIPVNTDDRIGSTYPDVLDGQWYVPYVLRGVELEMLEAEKETGLIYPHKSVSRGEFLMMMTKAFDLTTNIPYQFADIQPDSEAANYAGLAWRYNLFRDTSAPDMLDPERRISHQEAIDVIFRLLNAEPSLQPTPHMFPVHSAATEEESNSSLLKSLVDTFRPAADEETHETARPIIPTIQSVKLAVLQLIRTKTSLADTTRREMIDAINRVRKQYNVAPVYSNPHLELSAQRHAKDMYRRGYFSHYTPEGKSYVDRIKTTGYLSIDPHACSCGRSVNTSGPSHIIATQNQCTCQPIFSLGENIAKGQLSVEQVMQEWLDSPNHRMNILRPQFNEVGIGLFGDIWVQNFGRLDVP